MRIKITLVACAVIALMLLGVAYHEYQGKVHKKVVAKDSAISRLQVELSSARAANDKLVAKYNGLWEQCQKGVSAYGVLTPAQKTAVKATAPTCGLSIVQ